MRKLVLSLLALPAIATAESGKLDVDRPEKASDKADRVICKTFAHTGSLIATDRECRTKRDWDRLRSRTISSPLASSCRPNANGICGG